MKRPERERVFLAQINREVLVNFITLVDDEWMGDQFGYEKVAKAFTAEGFDLDVILAIFWRLVDTDSKKIILGLKVVKEENMELKELVFTEPVSKLRHIISGQQEIERIIGSIVQMRIKSNPNLVENLKKKVTEAKDSASMPPST